jgi:hypothetical protein
MQLQIPLENLSKNLISKTPRPKFQSKKIYKEKRLARAVKDSQKYDAQNSLVQKY